ncbi:hypothetical protein GQX74_007515 [Glossina fuscipes]|nr:hypothetical protein GQX74_007515 [Glossina fuscipes]
MKSVMSSYEMRSSASAHTQRYATAATTTDNDVTKHTLKDVENTRSAFMQTPICANVLKINVNACVEAHNYRVQLFSDELCSPWTLILLPIDKSCEYITIILCEHSSLTNSKVLKADFLLYLQQCNILACTFPTENTKIWSRFSKRLGSRKISCQWNQCE